MFEQIRKRLNLSTPLQSDTRTVYVATNFPKDDTQKFADNKVTSSKYTAWNFIPKNLFQQFKKIANFYFLLILLVQLLIDTPTSPVTSGLPLFFVIVTTAIKQGYEDFLLHKADDEVNNAEVCVIRSSGFLTTVSKNIRVGDIVRVNREDIFPADLVLLASDNDEGTCSVTTASLDGETNLKTHTAIPETASLQSISSLVSIKAIVECQQPEADLYRFVGRIRVTHEGEEIVRPLGPENLLLRGARLKNTKEIFGAVVYTGMETKMALNYKTKSHKRSVVDKSMNTFLMIYLAILLFLAFLCTILKYSWKSGLNIHQPWYNKPSAREMERSHGEQVISDFLAFLVLYNLIIPISLYVTVEMQKFLGSFFISWDIDFYYEQTDEKAQVNTSDLNEELGQVEYVFTDKTGTLTENEMELQECSINGVKYQLRDGKLVGEDVIKGSSSPSSFTCEEVMFLRAVALCHTVQINTEDQDHLEDIQKNGITSKIEYFATSPDEKALVEAANRIGVSFVGAHGDIMHIKVFKEQETYKLLHVLEFDSKRRRMSVILKGPSDEMLLFTKGAESSILPFVKSGEAEKTRVHVDEFALNGLRTLVFACRHLSEKEYLEINQQLYEAKTALVQREEKLDSVFNFIENNLELLGATGVEDKLQDNVKETIEALRMAGIKVWVLTGDKYETAVSISLSCGHFNQNMKILELVQVDTEADCAEKMAQFDNQVKEDPDTEHSLVVDGASLSLILKENEELFMDVCSNCSTVLCCRMAPLQKAKVVQLLKTSPQRPVTLAIGDGANDVSMIQEAHVGIGIMGKEGRQAVRNSDYAFARFKYLSKLLLVHGHFYYIRITTLVQYFFYKNVCCVMPQVLFQFYCLFTQQTLYDSAHLTLYNISFTSLPILAYSLFEQKVPPSVLHNNPILYKDISKNALLSHKPFLYWTVLGFSHGFMFFFGPFLFTGENRSALSTGQNFGSWTFGTFVYTNMFVTVTLKLAIETSYWTWLNHFATWGSIIFYYIFSLFYGGIIWPFLKNQDMYYVFIIYVCSGTAWFSLIIIILLCLIPDIFKTILCRHIWPMHTQCFQKQEKEASEQMNSIRA
uniref:Phospholipid-transporting ATPase n=2 Tax=Erpetoichthys calabaricus TaxID=27687 RepID=A0A8C4XGF6_ERPCA